MACEVFASGAILLSLCVTFSLIALLVSLLKIVKQSRQINRLNAALIENARKVE